jgi:GT2 family glycosyltransferase
MMLFSLVIPTYKRPDALITTMDSVLKNTRLPDEIIIVDDDITASELRENFRVQCEELGVSFTYHQKNHEVNRRGLSESKNLAASIAAQEIIFYLDDDVILDTKYFTEIMQVWEQHELADSLIGVGGRISNNRPTGKFEKIYRKLFGLTGDCAWDVNKVGFQVWDEGVTDTVKGYYLHGGVSSYRRALLQKYPFEVFSGGRTGLEDVEHCLRAKNAGYHFYYVPSAHLTHHPAPAGREAHFAAAKKESINRRQMWLLHSSHSFFSRLNFFRANVGWIGKKLLSLQFHSATGLIVGLFWK